MAPALLRWGHFDQDKSRLLPSDNRQVNFGRYILIRTPVGDTVDEISITISEQQTTKLVCKHLSISALHKSVHTNIQVCSKTPERCNILGNKEIRAFRQHNARLKRELNITTYPPPGDVDSHRRIIMQHKVGAFCRITDRRKNHLADVDVGRRALCWRDKAAFDGMDPVEVGATRLNVCRLQG